MGRTMSGAMTVTDIRKFHDGTLPQLDYGYDGYPGRMLTISNIPIHIPVSDSDNDEADDDILDSRYVGLDRLTNIPKGLPDQSSSLNLSIVFCRLVLIEIVTITRMSKRPSC
jgi:hypothetical protein